MINAIVPALMELISLTMRIVDIARQNKDLNEADKAMFKAKIREMQNKVKKWDE